MTSLFLIARCSVHFPLGRIRRSAPTNSNELFYKHPILHYAFCIFPSSRALRRAISASSAGVLAFFSSTRDLWLR